MIVIIDLYTSLYVYISCLLRMVFVYFSLTLQVGRLYLCSKIKTSRKRKLKLVRTIIFVFLPTAKGLTQNLNLRTNLKLEYNKRLPPLYSTELKISSLVPILLNYVFSLFWHDQWLKVYIFTELSPLNFVFVIIVCLSEQYLGKYIRDWNETWVIDKCQWEEAHCTRTIILPCIFTVLSSNNHLFIS